MDTQTTTAVPSKADYAFINKFNNDFFTNINAFQQYSNYDINKNAYQLVHVIMKGFPQLALEIMSVYSPAIKFNECPELIRALQHKFVNGFSRNYGKFRYYKSSPKKAKVLGGVKKIVRRKKADVEIYEFSDEIQMEIKSRLFIDGKTYEQIKESEIVQHMGVELMKAFQSREIKIIKKVIK